MPTTARMTSRRGSSGNRGFMTTGHLARRFFLRCRRSRPRPIAVLSFFAAALLCSPLPAVAQAPRAARAPAVGKPAAGRLVDFPLGSHPAQVGTQVSGGSSPNVTFGIGPAVIASGAARAFFNFSMTPGAQSSDGAEVLNYSLTPITVSVYPTDVLNDPDGTTSFPAGSAKPRDAGSWISLLIPSSATTITIPARNGVVIPFRVAVPRNAQPGDHEAGIIVSLATEARNKQGDLVQLDQRVATRAFFRISGKLRSDIVIQKLGGSYRQNYDPLGKGTVTVSYQVRNLGNLRVDVTQTVTFKPLLAHAQGARGLPVLTNFLPGGSDSVTVHFTDVPPELLGKATVNLALSPPLGVEDPPLNPVSATATIWLIPLALLLIVLVLVLVWLYRRRRRRARETSQGTPVGGDRLEAPPGQPDRQEAGAETANKASS